MEKQTAEIRNSLDVHDGKFILGPVKADASEGEIPLPDIVVSALKAEKVKQKNKMLWSEAYQNEGYCWANENGSPHNPDFPYHKLVKIIKAYNAQIDANVSLNEKEKESIQLPVIRFHDLRHTHATLLLRAHIDTKVVSKKLRHSDFRFTAQRYQHVQDDIIRETANAMDKMFSLENGLDK